MHALRCVALARTTQPWKTMDDYAEYSLAARLRTDEATIPVGWLIGVEQSVDRIGYAPRALIACSIGAGDGRDAMDPSHFIYTTKSSYDHAKTSQDTSWMFLSLCHIAQRMAVKKHQCSRVSKVDSEVTSARRSTGSQFRIFEKAAHRQRIVLLQGVCIESQNRSRESKPKARRPRDH